MMLRISKILVFGTIITVAICADTSAQDIESQTRALKVISDFAAEQCGAVSIEGRSKHLEVTGDAKAQLDGLIAKVVNAGISGAAKYQQQDYKNVLHEQLAQRLNDGANCRIAVFKLLQEKMVH